MTDARHDVMLTTADDRGIPTAARCSCGWTWTRPAGDWWADSLPPAARAHRRATP